MKKRGLLIFLIILTLFVFTGCGKKALTTEDFEAKAKDSGFTVKDYTGEIDDYEHIKHVTVAKADGNWQVQFYELYDIDSAQQTFDKYKMDFEKHKDSSSAESSSSDDNYSMYTLLSQGYYMYICRVDNTILYAKVDEENKDNVKRFMNSLGY